MDTSHAAVVAKQPDRAWRCGREPGTWAACGGSPHAACPALTQRWRAGDTPPLPSSKTRPWALVSLTVRVRPLKGLISPKEPSQMSPGITDPLSPCSSVRRCFHPSAHHSLPTLAEKTERSWEARAGSPSPCSQRSPSAQALCESQQLNKVYVDG